MRLQDEMGLCGSQGKRGIPLPIDLYKRQSNGTQIGWLFGRFESLGLPAEWFCLSARDDLLHFGAIVAYAELHCLTP